YVVSGRLKRAVYARLEETSFRSGAGAVATMLVVLVVAGVAIALAVLLNGHSAAVAAPQGTVPGTPASRSAPAVPSSSAVIPADTATPAPAPGTPSQPVTA